MKKWHLYHTVLVMAAWVMGVGIAIATGPVEAQRPVVPPGQEVGVGDLAEAVTPRKLERRLASADAIRLELVLDLASGGGVDDVGAVVHALVMSGGNSIETVTVGREWLVEFLAREGSPVTAAQLAALVVALRDEAESKLLLGGGQ